MLLQCWFTVLDAGPALEEHWVNTSCLLLCALILGDTVSFFHKVGVFLQPTLIE